MKYKRLEIYTGWKCNHKCVFCIEYPNIDKAWDKKITKEEITKKLLKYRKNGFNHVTFLGGEPFIHEVFPFGIRFAKKLGYTVMVTTNGSMLQFENISKKELGYIDQLIISIPTIDPEEQLKINRTKSQINFNKIFSNIEKYWDGNFLKINTVINKYNLDSIINVIEYLGERGVKEMSITYPDLIIPYYSKKFVLENIAPSYKDVSLKIENWFKISKKYGINLVLTDLPFCVIKNDNYFEKTDDFMYQSRLKIDIDENELDRDIESPRRRKHIDECDKCSYKNICWGPSFHYNELYGFKEIKALK